jgi:hypothetical protein
VTAVVILVFWFLIPAALVLIWILFRSGGYKRQPLDAPPGGDWTLTGERFVDPGSGETLEVWFRAGAGERAYVRARSGQSD